MLKLKLSTLISLVALTASSCDRKDSPSSKKPVPSVSLTNGTTLIDIPETSLIPTTPEGGLLPHKEKPLSIEENLRRRKVNSRTTIEFGKSAGGITLTTSRGEAKNILSTPSRMTETLDIYPEGLLIIWGEGLNPTPKTMIIQNAYEGSLKLPMPYGDTKLSSVIKGLGGGLAERQKLARVIGRSIEGGDESYDCLALLTCAVEIRSNLTFLDFSKGILVLNEASLIAIQMMNHHAIRPTNDRNMVFGTSIAGIDFDMTRADVEALLGPAYSYPSLTSDNRPLSLYDGKTIEVAYTNKSHNDARPTDRIQLIIVKSGYAGTMFIAGAPRGIDSSFADLRGGQDDPDGTVLMLALGRALHGMEADPAYNCQTLQPARCKKEIAKTGDILTVQIDSTIFNFTLDDQTLLLSVTAEAPTK